MWKVIARYRDVDYIIHDDRVTDEECKVISPTLIVEDNKSGTLEFTICPSNNGYNKIYPMLTECRVLKNGKIIWFGRVLTADSDFYKRMKIHCEGGLSYLCDFYYPTETLPDPNYKYAFPQAVDGIMYWYNETLTDSKFISYGLFRSFTGKTVAFDGKEVVGRYDEEFIKKTGSDSYRAWPYPERSSMTILDWLLSSTEYYNGHLFVTRETASDGTWIQYLNFKSGYNTWTGQTIRFGENLLDYTKSIDGSNFHTAVRPYGSVEITNGDQNETIVIDVRYILKNFFNDADKQDFVVTNSATDPSQNYVMTFDKSRNIAYCHSFETNMPEVDGSMQTWADVYGIICKQFEINSVGSEFVGRLISHFRETKPESMVIEIRAVDMDLLGATSSDIEILDMIHVISKPHNVDGYFPVTKIEYHLDDPSQTTYAIDTGAVESQSSVTGSSATSVDTKITSSGYKHPMYKENSLGFYKFANDAIGSITDAQPVTKKDITDLGIPESDTNTTYRVTSGLFPSFHGVTLKGNDGSSSNAPLDTYRRSLNLSDVTAIDMNRVTERGYLVSTYGYAFNLIVSRYDSSHPFEMDGSYRKDNEEFNFNVRGDITISLNKVTISNLSIECDDPDNQLSVYAYNVIESASEDHDYVYYYTWLAVYSKKDLTGWTSAHLASVHYTDGEYIEPSSPPDSEHSVDYVRMTEQVVKTSDTTYELAQYKDLHDTVPNGPIVSLKDSTGAFTDAVVPCAMTCSSWDAVYKEYYGNIPGNNRYASLLDIVYQDSSDYILPVIIDTHLVVKYGAVQYACRVKIYHATDPNNYTYAEVFPPPILSSPKIKWTVLTFRVSSNYVFYRICIDQTTMQNIFDSTGVARLLFVTSEDGKLLSQAQRTADLDAYLDEYYGEPVTTYTTLSSRNAPDVAFTGDYNDLSNKPTIPDISGKQDKSTAVTHTANTAVGSATKPVYVAVNGVATPISHSINSDVPANAKFTDTTYNDATQSTHGLMTAADKKKLDGMDLSKYLPLSGGVMTGDIDIVANQKELLVGSRPTTNNAYATPVVGGFVHKADTMTNATPSLRSYIGSYRNTSLNRDYLLVSVRHRNGYQLDGGDGSSYGMMIYSELTSAGNLYWNKQVGKDKWLGERVLLDSTNYSRYAAKVDHTHTMITNSALWASGANNTAKWVRLGALVSSGNFSNGVIRVWTGNGANGHAYQNSSFEIQIKDGWQSTESATKACGVTVYRINCSSVKVKVIPTAHDTYTVWVYMPWGYWDGNYAVYGKYKSWTSQHLIQSDEPEGTGADIAYYDQAFLTSTVAKSTEATALTETAWTAVPATGASETVYNSVQYLKSGNMIFVQGAIGFKAGLNSPTCGTMPSGLLPGIELCFTGWDYASGVPTAYPIKLAKNGVITLLNPTSTAYWFKAGRLYHFNFSYHIN